MKHMWIEAESIYEKKKIIRHKWLQFHICSDFCEVDNKFTMKLTY